MNDLGVDGLKSFEIFTMPRSFPAAASDVLA
jgi:hypothetical protein